MYLDLDNECYTPAEAVYKEYDVVLQGTGFEGLNNGMMASRPGHPLFIKYPLLFQSAIMNNTSSCCLKP